MLEGSWRKHLTLLGHDSRTSCHLHEGFPTDLAKATASSVDKQCFCWHARYLPLSNKRALSWPICPRRNTTPPTLPTSEFAPLTTSPSSAPLAPYLPHQPLPCSDLSRLFWPLPELRYKLQGSISIIWRGTERRSWYRRRIWMDSRNLRCWSVTVYRS